MALFWFKIKYFVTRLYAGLQMTNMKRFRQILSTAIIPVLCTVTSGAQINTPVYIDITSPDRVAADGFRDTFRQEANTIHVYTTDHACESIARVWTFVDLGLVSCEVVVNNEAFTFFNNPFVGRYFKIIPEHNLLHPNWVALYFTPQDFERYNRHPRVVAGHFPAIDARADNLVITVFHGVPDDDNTGPDNEYDINRATVIKPEVILNAQGYYEVYFNAPAFSGFFAHTEDRSGLSAENISNHDFQGISVFPNPVSDELNVVIQGSVGADPQIIINDNLGKVIYRGKVAQDGLMKIGTARWAQGIYYVRYQDGMRQKVIKVQKL